MPSPYRYAPAVPKQSATGLVARVYAQMSDDFLLADGPLMSLSPAPDVLAAAWALLREAELAGTASRAEKEAAASAVAVANRCPFCTEAHALLVHGTGEHRLAEAVRLGEIPDDPRQAALVEWAAATRSPGAVALDTPPLPLGERAEFVGTVLVSHFINRMVSALLDETALLPGVLVRSQLVRRTAGRTIRRTARQQPAPGRSLELLPPTDPTAQPSWAGDGPIGRAYTALRSAALAGGELLSPAARTAVRATVDRWDGSHPPLGAAWLSEPLAALPDEERPGARLALLAALAPYRVTDADVSAWRADRRTDAELVRLLAFGAMTAVGRIEEWTTAPASGPDAHSLR